MRKTTRIRGAALALLLAACGTLRAQDDGNRPGDGGNSGAYPMSKAHVPEVDRATAKIHQAADAVTKKNWPLAVRNLQQVLEQYPQYVYEVKSKEGLFQGIREHCTQQLLAMPPEARAVYRELFDERARSRYEEAMRTLDRGRLQELAETWPLSGWAHRAAGVLGSLLLEEGAVREAIPFLEQACASDLPEVARRWYLPLASAHTKIGDRAALERLAGRFGAAVGDSTLMAGGNAIDVLRTVKEWAARIPAPDAAAAAGRTAWDRWECLGGDATRSRPVAPSLDLPEKRWQVTIPQGATPGTFAREFVREQYTPTGEETYTPYFPVVADGIVYLHNDVQVLAFELLASQHGGRRLWAWPVPQRMPTTDVIFEPHALHSSTLADGRLFVNLVWTRAEPERQLDWLDVKLPLPNRALLALDAQTGRLLWRVGGARSGEGSAEFAERASIACAPAVVGSELFVGAVYQANATNPIEHYVCKIDAVTGELRWRANVCSGFLEMNLFNNPTRESVGTPVTVHRDLALYCTNMGVTTAVETRTGRVRWLRRYRQLPIGPTRDIHSERMPTSWANNPIFVHGDRMFVAPTDSPYLYAYDVETGRELWKHVRNEYDTRRSGVDQERFVLGLLGDALILSGDSVVALDVLREGRRRWTWRPAEANDRILGRGVCAREHVYVPTRFGLYRLAADGKADAPPAGKPEDKGRATFKWYERDAGNVLIADNVLLSATPRQLIAFFSMASIEKQIAAELAKNPDDPYLRYRIGLSHQKADRWAEAARDLEEAVRLAEKRGDRPSQLTAEHARQALYRMYLDLGRLAWDKHQRKEALEHFERAKQWARDEGAVVEIAFTVSALLHEDDAHAEALTELQAVIDRHPEVAYGRGSARDYAREHIQVILNAVGRTAYAPFEEQARTLLSAAEGSRLIDDYARVVRRFPNSLAAETALLRSAEILFAAELVPDAQERLRLLLEYRQSALLPQGYRLLVLCHERRGTFTSARNCLMQLLRKFPDARLAEDGGFATAKQFVQDRLRRPEYQQAAGAGRRRELAAPVRLAWTWSDPGSTDLCLLTPGGPMPREAADLVFLASRGVVRAVRWNTGEEVWRAQVEKDQRAGQCVFFDQHLIVAGQNTVFALSVQDGREQWRVPFDDYLPQNLRVSEGLVFLVASNRINKDIMVLRALDAASGQEAWTYPYRGTPDDWFVGEEFVVVPSGIKDLTVLDREKGTQVGTIGLPARYVRLIMPSPNRLVAMTSRNVLSCWDVPAGKKLWQVETGLIAPDSLLSSQGLVAFVERVENNLQQPMLVVIDPETGKRKVRAKVSDGDFPANGMGIDETAIYITFRERQARDRIYVAAFALADGRRLWMAPRAGNGSLQLFNPILSGPWFLLNGAVLEPGTQRWSPVSQVIQRSDGARVQEIAPESVLQMTPSVTVENGMLAVVHGAQIFAYVGE